MDAPSEDRAARGRAATIGLVLGPIAFAVLWLVPLPTLRIDGRPVEAGESARVVLGLTAWMAVWWLTEALPLAATALLPLAVLPAWGVTPAPAVAPAYFGDPIALFLGGFCLALAMEKCGLHRRIAHRVVRAVGTRPRPLVFGFFAASAILSMWVSNTATTLMLMPVAATVVSAALERVRDGGADAGQVRNFAACCVLGVAYGASLGGIGTLVGTPPNVIFQGTYRELFDRTVTFGEWMALGVPLVVVLVPLAWLALVRGVLPVPARIEGLDGDALLAQVRPQGRPDFATWAVATVFAATAAAWLTHQAIDFGGWTVPLTGWDEAFRRGARSSFVTDGTIATVAALLLFALPSRAARGDRLLTWEWAGPRLPWSALILFGGGFALAEAFKPSGLNLWLQAAFSGLEGLPHWLVILAVAAGMTALSEVASNTAATQLMLPVLAAVATATGMAPLPLMLAGTLAASCGFALPVATPPNTIAFGTGLVSVRQMGRAGLVLDLIGTVVIVLAVLWLAPWAIG